MRAISLILLICWLCLSTNAMLLRRLSSTLFSRPSNLKLPVNASILLLDQYIDKFTSIEQEELRSVGKVYYLSKLSKSQREQVAVHDSKSKQRYPKLEPDDQILFKYRIHQIIATGSSGKVIKAIDMSSPDQRAVAIKFVPRHHDIFKEHVILSLLRPLNETSSSKSIIKLIEVVKYRGWSGFVFPYYEKDWFTVSAEVHENGRQFHLRDLRMLARNMVQALLYLKSRRIIHRDLKPENILYDSTSRKSYLTDFGAALRVEPQMMENYHVAGTMAFMAPEILMNAGYPTYAVDMWSLGATLFTLMTKKHILTTDRHPDGSLLHCLPELIRRVPPESQTVNGVEIPLSSTQNALPLNRKRYKIFTEDLEQLKDHFRQKGKKKRYDEFIDFISRCLIWDPTQRMTVEQAIQHPFVMLG